jgi:tRNA (cytidine/uridine-2'-O-)-methyltransferase
MFKVILFEPEIPPNTGNIIRLCANTGTALHLIHPLGFAWDNKRLKRAGLDYSEHTIVTHHQGYDDFAEISDSSRIFAISTKGRRHHHEVEFRPGDSFIFGPETRGLPEEVLATVQHEHILRIPMQIGSRSLNLSNSVAIILYEAWRQLGFTNAL